MIIIRTQVKQNRRRKGYKKTEITKHTLLTSKPSYTSAMPLNKIPNHIIALKVHLFKTNIT